MESNVIWAIAYGEWPDGHLSNINGDISDNRISNLYISGRQKKFDKDSFNFFFDYINGKLFWKVSKPPMVKAGEIAGNINSNGYILVGFNGKRLREHRIIWTMFNEEISKGFEIDHINGIRHDNRIENLRLVSRKQNCQNSFTRKDNKTGCKGVHFRKDTGKYSSTIQIDNEVIHLGCFDDLEAAKKARLDAEIKHHQFRKVIK